MVNNMKISILISSLSTEKSSIRMRVWRAIKNNGAATLRDGVYLLPSEYADKFDQIIHEHTNENGIAHIFHTECPENLNLHAIFDKSAEYIELSKQLNDLEKQLDIAKKNEHLKQIRKIRKNLNNLIQIDYFPTSIKEKVTKELAALEHIIARLGEIDEPQFISQSVKQYDTKSFQNMVWATRKRPWIDRLASAWLIQKFIDPSAQFIWLDSPSDCPKDATGYDFDGATFTHIDTLVTFEVLIQSFQLGNPALNKIAQIVHYLDVGGHEVPEAIGLEKVIHGLKTTILDDDQLLKLSNLIFDGLYADLLGEEHGSS